MEMERVKTAKLDNKLNNIAAYIEILNKIRVILIFIDPSILDCALFGHTHTHIHTVYNIQCHSILLRNSSVTLVEELDFDVDMDEDEIEELDMSDKSLKTLPICVCSLKFNGLYLENNELQTLPYEIGLLEN